ncbi:MAG: hypothetical protein Q9220_005263 [cf. Caloplaca sp. 1 TL-2023]
MPSKKLRGLFAASMPELNWYNAGRSVRECPGALTGSAETVSDSMTPASVQKELPASLRLCDNYVLTQLTPQAREIMSTKIDESVDDCSSKGDNDDVVPRLAIDDDPGYSYKEQRDIIHRVDRRLVVTLGLIYCLAQIDRGNMGNASIAGMRDDLGLNIGYRYSITVLVFSPTYIIFQPLTTVLTRKLGPRIFLAAITLLWGATQIGFGFVNKWIDLAGLRTVLGIFEAGVYPSAVYLLATWYSRYDVGKRYFGFYVIGCIALAFGGILAYGLMQMEGLAGRSGWRWIFIMEGTITCAASFLAYFFLVDFPERADQSWRFLNRDERDFILRRIEKDRNDTKLEPFTFGRFLRPALDLKIWIFGLISFFIITTSSAVAILLPIILRDNMGFSIAASQCLIAPPYTLAALVMALSAYLGDRYHIRGPILIANSLLTLVGLPIMGFAPSPGVRYFGVFLLTAGANANIPVALAYQANNTRGQWNRAFCSAVFVGVGGIGHISGATIFRSQDSPRYIPGIAGAIA